MHGITPEFWARGTMVANEVQQRSESYFPTLGLREITAASENGAVYLSSSEAGADTLLSAVATLTLPDQAIRAKLRLDGDPVREQDVIVSTTASTTVSAIVASSQIPSGAIFEVEFLQGETSLLSGHVALD
ncbi:MAG: hypothetical protein JW751_23015 [Polyangiaceae bacterium]|nr:hypothetical protein [Polyangiaceae bacterium]